MRRGYDPTAYENRARPQRFVEGGADNPTDLLVLSSELNMIRLVHRSALLYT
jgi:hypothetical protein